MFIGLEHALKLLSLNRLEHLLSQDTLLPGLIKHTLKLLLTNRVILAGLNHTGVHIGVLFLCRYLLLLSRSEVFSLALQSQLVSERL